MQCPQCLFDNPKDMLFCGQCGAPLNRQCPSCNQLSPPGFKFCGMCGAELGRGAEPRDRPILPERARKYVTVLFSDLTGYTELCERLDPEEASETSATVFNALSEIVAKYDGFIEKYIGDAIMVLFGFPTTHEDDPVRALKAAQEMHAVLKHMSPQLRKAVGHPLSLHSGIHTGLVVTGSADCSQGRHGVSGDTINIASRLCSLAKPDEILVSQVTYRLSAALFTFEEKAPVQVKGKQAPIRVYRLSGRRDTALTGRALHGYRAALIGRKVELSILREAYRDIQQRRGGVVTICGEAGTGKSRLIEEFKSELAGTKVQWRIGRGYSYAQDMPFSVLSDLLRNAFQLRETDSPSEIKAKLQARLADLAADTETILPYIGSLFALHYDELSALSPDSWKLRLYQALQKILSRLVMTGPTIICFEDLHWSDTPSLELLRGILLELRLPALFICSFRPPFELLPKRELEGRDLFVREVRLQELSPSETRDMLESLLELNEPPQVLSAFVQERAGGNPFYIEEIINTLIEGNILVADTHGWRVSKPALEAALSPTVHGLLFARIDRLDSASKRVLQEAAVTGGTFSYDLLLQATTCPEALEDALGELERLDLIQIMPSQTHPEYAFKHSLIHEAVSATLVRKEKQAIHERIGCALEQLHRDRLPEFYETLAYHFSQGLSASKAVEYAMRSGEKSTQRYALDSAQSYLSQAFECMRAKQNRSVEENGQLIDIMTMWSKVYYYRGEFRELMNLLEEHQDFVESVADEDRLGMYYAWLSCGLWHRERFLEAYHYLTKALEIGRKTGNDNVVGYACTWLVWTCSDLGSFDEAVARADEAQELYRLGRADDYVFFNSLAGKGFVSWHQGNRQQARSIGEQLLEFGQAHANIRSTVMGHCCIGFSHIVDGDLDSAVSSFEQAVDVSLDPWFAQFPKLALSYASISFGRLEQAKRILQELKSFSREHGAEYTGTPAEFLWEVLSVAEGRASEGLPTLKGMLKVWLDNRSKLRALTFSHVLALLYARMSTGRTDRKYSRLLHNAGFIFKEAPFAGKHAEHWFRTSIALAEEMGATALLGRLYLDFGLFFAARKKRQQSREYLSKAAALFEACQAQALWRKAKQGLQSLGQASGSAAVAAKIESEAVQDKDGS